MAIHAFGEEQENMWLFQGGKWQWLKIKELGANRRFWSMFPLARATHFGIPFF